MTDPIDFGTGIHVITISYNDDPQILPEIDLGDCSPWIAVTLLKAAMETLDLVIPPINVTYNGDSVIEHSPVDQDYYDEEE